MAVSDQSSVTKSPPDKKLWLVYISLALAGLLILGTEYHWPHISRWTARLGLALVYSALALGIARGRRSGLIAAVIIWVAAVVCWFV